MTIEELLAAAMKSAPPLVVLVIVVWLFIKSRDRSDERLDAICRNFSDTVRQIAADSKETAKACHEAQARSIESTIKNTAATRELREEIHALSQKLG